MTHALFVLWWAALGLVVGSFLNVAIHRLPREGETVARPRRSRCPKCRTPLRWQDNVPVLSWVLLRGRCRSCGWGIPVRYPLVEILTALLWALAADLAGPGAWDLVLVHVVVLSGLVVSTFVDFEHFEIPDEVSIGGMVLAPLASVAVPALHESTAVAAWLSSGEGVDRTGAFLGSLAGIAVGGGVLLAVGWLGKRLYAREAMGLGDVKLLAAGGGFVGPGGALVGLLIGALIASLIGILNILRFLWLVRSRASKRGTQKSIGRSMRVARVAGRYLPFGPYLGIGIGIVLLDWNDVVELWRGLAF